MPVGIGDLWVVHSGGASEDDLGGAISTEASKRVISQNGTRAVSNIGGVTIDDAFGNPEGTGTLYYDDTNTTLGWRPYGGSTFYGVNVAVNGTYVIGSSGGYLVVTTSNIPTGSDLYDDVQVANNVNNVFGSVSATDSLIGVTEYRCLYILNNHPTDTAANVKVWIDTNTPAGDTIDIGIDPIGKNGVATTTTGTSAPVGVVFSAPASQGAGLPATTLQLLAGEYIAFWQRRTVPEETRGTVISNGAAIAISIDV